MKISEVRAKLDKAIEEMKTEVVTLEVQIEEKVKLRRLLEPKKKKSNEDAPKKKRKSAKKKAAKSDPTE